MAAPDKIPEFPTELKTQIAEALDKMDNGIRDPEAARAACEHMDRVREENRKIFGEQNWIVETIRKMREAQ